MTTPSLPAGAAWLTADQLAEILATGDHPETRAPAEFDTAVVELVREGTLVACRLDDGRVAFSGTDR
jgi:hypothetical protein